MKIELTREEMELLLVNMDQIRVEYGKIEDLYLYSKLQDILNNWEDE